MGDCGIQAACRGVWARLQIGGRKERTLNMPPISVTLVVSKLSGWLNLDASCRKAGGGRQLGGSGRPRCTQRAKEGPRLQIGGGARGQERTTNIPRMFVTLDVSKLRGWLNFVASCRES